MWRRRSSLSKPTVRVIGVEPAGAAKMTASFAAGHPVTLEHTDSIADGLLALRPGDLTFAHLRRYLDAVVHGGGGGDRRGSPVAVFRRLDWSPNRAGR